MEEIIYTFLCRFDVEEEEEEVIVQLSQADRRKVRKKLDCQPTWDGL